MICPHCGAAIDDRSAFCTNCGQPVTPAAEIPTTAAVDPDATQLQQVDATMVQPTPLETPIPQPVVPQPVGSDGSPLIPSVNTQQQAAVDQTYVQPTPQAAPQATSQAYVEPQYAQTQQQASYQAPAQAGQYQVPQQATYQTAPTQKKSILPKIAAGIIAAVLGIFGISRIMGGRNINTGSGSGHVIGEEAPETAAGALLDARGNPTFRAMTELSGSDFAELLEGEGFKWQETNLWWTSRDQNNAVWVMGPADYEYTHDDILSLPAESLGEATEFACALDDRNYSSAANAFNALVGDLEHDEYWVDDETGMAIVTNSSGRRYAVLTTTDLDNGLYRFALVSPEGIDKGMLQDLAGTYGTTLDEVWEEITGVSLPSGLVTQNPLNIDTSDGSDEGQDTSQTDEHPFTTGHVIGTEAPTSSRSALLDSRGNPTFVAMSEISGAELVETIEADGFTWSESDLWWTSHDNNDAFWVMGANDYEYKHDEVAALPAEGTGEAIYYACALDDRDYSSARNALYSLANSGLVDEYWFNDETAIAIFENNSGRRYAVIETTDLDIGLYRFTVFTPEAIEQGLLASVIGDEDNNTSLDVIWQEYTGRDIAS